MKRKALPCDCGGMLHPTTLDEYDFEPLAGLPSKLVKVTGARCDRCGATTVPGEVIEGALEALARAVVALPRLLRPVEARFLRKRLGLTQRELSERMDIRRETVAEWEADDGGISPQHDFILRVLAVPSLGSGTTVFPFTTAVRTARPKRGKAPPLIIERAALGRREFVRA